MRTALSLLLSGAVGCTGYVKGGGFDEGRPTLSGTAPPGTASPGAAAAAAMAPVSGIAAPSACSTHSPGPKKLRRLTANQFRATVVDLFKDERVPSVTLFSDPQVLGFSNDADALVVQGLTAQQLADYSEQVARWAVTSKLDSLGSCQSMDASCRESFVKSFGKRAFREPLSDEQVNSYVGLMAGEATWGAAVEAALTAFLQSPYFLYRRELGPVTSSSGTVHLTPYEVASSLSYLLIGSMPDDALLSAADDGSLATPSVLDQQAERLLQDSRSDVALMDFFGGWLGLGRLDTTVKSDEVFKLTGELKTSMKAETRSFLLDLFKNGGRVSDLFNAGYSFLDQQLADFYRIKPEAGVTLSGTPTKVSYGANVQRDPGLLGQASLLSGYADAESSSPVLRGKFVLARLLCEQLPPPPSNLKTQLAPAVATETTRQHFEAHSKNPVCAACHQRMDPIGDAFEHYDAFGRYRDQENGVSIDASGHTFGLASGDVSFNGVRELSRYLADSDAVKSCVVRYWSYFAYGLVSWPEDSCTYDAVRSAAAASDMKLRDVLLGVLHAPRFTQRREP